MDFNKLIDMFQGESKLAEVAAEHAGDTDDRALESAFMSLRDALDDVVQALKDREEMRNNLSQVWR